MKRVYRCCAGLDIHQKSVTACIRSSRYQTVTTIKAVFGTFTEDLTALVQWLKQNKVRHVAMESTGVYWVPVWNILEQAKRFQLTLVNPLHARAIPGKKTDQLDCERLAELHSYGLLRASFIPPPPIRELRDLTRRRTHMQQDRNRVINRIRRLLETANIKLASVLSDVIGQTGRSILEGLATTHFEKLELLAELAKGTLKQKKPELRKALRVKVTPHFQFLLAELLEQIDWLDRKIASLEERIRAKMAPYEGHIQRLCTIPGIQRITAWTIIAEIGVDMSRFPSTAHLASWAGVCPGNCESAGKRHSSRTRKGDRYLRRILTQSAWAIARRKDGGFLTTLFFRIAGRGGMKKAAVAVAHRLLEIIHRLLSEGSQYVDLGANFYDRRNPTRAAKKLIGRLEQLGLDVTIRPRSSA